MPKRRRLAALTILAAMLAACSGSPSGSPNASPSGLTPSAAASTPEPTRAAAAPTPSPTVRPASTPIPPRAEGCAGIDEVDFADLEAELGSVDADGNGGVGGISVGHVAAFLQVTRVTEVSGQRRSIVPPERELHHERGQLLGGHEFVAFPSLWFDGHLNPQAMISASVVLTLEGHAPLDLPTRFIPGNENFDQVAVRVPDASGPAVLEFDFAWADPCFRYAASSTLSVDVVPLSATAGCALDSSGYLDQVAELLAGSLRVGSTIPHAFSPRNEAKFASFLNPGIDAFIQYAFNPDDPAIVAAPDSVLRIEQTSSGITLGNDMTLSVWTRASIAKAVKDYPPHGTVLVLSRTPVKQPDGSFRLRVPHDPGRYVAAVVLTYDSQCSSGALWFVVNLDVVAPTASPTPSPAAP